MSPITATWPRPPIAPSGSRIRKATPRPTSHRLPPKKFQRKLHVRTSMTVLVRLMPSCWSCHATGPVMKFQRKLHDRTSMKALDVLGQSPFSRTLDIPVVGLDIGSRSSKGVLLVGEEIYTAIVPTGLY